MCPKCSGTQLNSEMKMGKFVRMQCNDCGYRGEYKEFKVEDSNEVGPYEFMYRALLKYYNSLV